MSWLVDEFEQTLHNKLNYAAALDHLLKVCPEFGEYMADFQLVLTGDYSTYFINFRCRNYDKATLCQLSDILFHVWNNMYG